MKKIVAIIIGLIILISSFSSILVARAECDPSEQSCPDAPMSVDLGEKDSSDNASDDGDGLFPKGGNTKELEKLMEEVEAEMEAEALKKTPTDLTDGTFPVNEVLRLDNGEQPKKYFNDPENASPIVAFIVEIIDFATIIMGSIAVILFIVAGFMFMFAYGNQQTLDKAKEIVTYAVIGLAVTFLSYIIVISVQSIFIAD